MINMKGLILITAFTAFLGEVSAQTAGTYKPWKKNHVTIQVGPEIAFASGAMAKSHNTGVGGSVLLDIPVVRRLSVVFYVGATHFRGDGASRQHQKDSSVTLIPIDLGVSYRLVKNLYASAQFGQSIIGYRGEIGGGLCQRLGIGYFIKNIDLGIHWNHYSTYGGLGSLNVRMAYAIKIGKN